MSQKPYTPPYTITDTIINLVAEISELVGTINALNNIEINPKLRQDNRIKTIHASLAIENNTLSINQVTDIIDGKRVLGDTIEIKEVQNAYEIYKNLLSYDPYSIKDLLLSHKVLMNDLTKEAGVFRSEGVGVFAGEKLVHMVPPANLVNKLITDLFGWAKTTKIHPLIMSCVFHYEFEFIHPFSDGNGRMVRMWQTLLLYKWKPIFAWLPVETIIKDRQDEYYKSLAICDKNSDCSVFIEFLLSAIKDSLLEINKTDQVPVQVTGQVKKLLLALGNEELSSADLMLKIGLKHRATFRENYLLPAIKLGLVEMTIPDKPNSNKQKYRIK